VLPSDPVTVTWVALVAVTVKVDEFPVVIEAGLAVMLTVGAGAADDVTVTVVLVKAFAPVPVEFAAVAV
jgi:hypothetical protein